MNTWYDQSPKIGIFISQEDGQQWAIFNSLAERIGRDGPFIMVPFIGPEAQKYLEAYAHPLVGLCGDLSHLRWHKSYTRRFPNRVSWTRCGFADVMVTVSEYELGQLGARGLIQLGLDDVFLVLQESQSIDGELSRGFRETVKRSGRTCDVLRITREQDYIEIIEGIPNPAGILAGDDWVASKIFRYAYDRGYPVPERLAVIGIGDNPIACSISGLGTLSSIPLPLREQGMKAAESILSLIAGSPPDPDSCLIHPRQIIHRASSDSVYFADEQVRTAVKHLKKAYPKERCLEEMYEISGISRRSLDRRFKLALDATPRETLEDMRLSHVKKLLLDRELKLEYIARCCGFESGWQLNRVFKRRYKIPPSDFRKSAMNT